MDLDHERSESAALLDVCCRLKLLEESGHRLPQTSHCRFLGDLGLVFLPGPQRSSPTSDRLMGVEPSTPPWSTRAIQWKANFPTFRAQARARARLREDLNSGTDLSSSDRDEFEFELDFRTVTPSPARWSREWGRWSREHVAARRSLRRRVRNPDHSTGRCLHVEPELEFDLDFRTETPSAGYERALRRLAVTD